MMWVFVVGPVAFGFLGGWVARGAMEHHARQEQRAMGRLRMIHPATRPLHLERARTGRAWEA